MAAGFTEIDILPRARARALVLRRPAPEGERHEHHA